MDKLFLIKLIVSFLVGGLAIASLSLFAEKASSKTAGLILSLPSTLAISFFFIGLIIPAQQVMEAAISVPPALGASLIFVTSYVYLAQVSLKNSASIFLSLICSFVVWFLLIIPFATLKPINISLSLIIYLCLALISHFFLTKNKDQNDITSTRFHYSLMQVLARSIFAGLVITLVVFLSKVAGPFWGGVFSVFPASYASNLLVFHQQLGAKSLFKFSRLLPLGSPAFIIYAFVAAYAFPQVGIILGTITAYLVSALFVYSLWGVRHKFTAK